MVLYSSVWKLFSESFLPLQRHWAQRQRLSLAWADEDPGSLCYGDSASVKCITGGSVGQFRLCSSSGDGRNPRTLWLICTTKPKWGIVCDSRGQTTQNHETENQTRPNLHLISWYTRTCSWQAGVSGLFQWSKMSLRFGLQLKSWPLLNTA